MARLDDFLAGWLRRRIARRGGTGATNNAAGPSDLDCPSKALADHAAAQDALLKRMKATAEKRRIIHEEMRSRHRQLKREFKEMKEVARLKQHEAWKWETKHRLVNTDCQAFQRAFRRQISRPGCVEVPVVESESQVRRFMSLKDRVWRHEMRLGVLRQHPPRPLDGQRLPRAVPPGPAASWPLISIVTPSYQQADYLERTMQSVLSQNYPRLEYHVWDGGSTDGSPGIIQRHASSLATWGSERDTGPASAINKGFARSTGEIMAWINSDDMFTPGTLNFVARYFATHPEVDVIYGHRYVVDDRDWQVGRWVLPPHCGETVLWADYIPQETLFWRREIWERAGGGLDESFKFAFDWDLLLRFQKAGARMVRLPWFLGCFRVHDLQKSSADISTVGMAEMARLRERELGDGFNLEQLGRRVVLYQHRAVWCDRLLRWGIHW